MGQRKNRNWWGLKTQLSNIKSGIWLLHRATTPTSPFSPDGTSETPRNTKYFPSSPVGWSVQEETFSDQKSSVFSVQSSPSPHSQCLSSYGLPGLGPKLKGCHLPPLWQTWPITSFPHHHQKSDTQTYLSTTCWYFNHQHLSVLASTEGTSLLFDPCTNDYSVRAFPVVTADCSRSQALGGHRGVLGESLGELEESFRISSSAIGWFSFFFSFWGWWQKTSIFYFFPFLFLPSFCWRVDFTFPLRICIW